jgi:hypothetical protein
MTYVMIVGQFDFEFLIPAVSCFSFQWFKKIQKWHFFLKKNTFIAVGQKNPPIFPLKSFTK